MLMKKCNMKIPKRFQLMGKTIRVKWDDALIYDRESIGRSNYRENTIVLQKSTKSEPMNVENQEHVFLHECLHHIFDVLGHSDMRTNEKLIDQISGLLHQIFVSSEY